MDEAVGTLSPLDPTDIADALLLVLDRRQLSAVTLVPDDAGVRVQGERGDEILVLESLDAIKGRAVSARLALLADLDPAGERKPEQLGRITTRQRGAHRVVEHLVTVRSADARTTVEVRTLARALNDEVGDERNRSIGAYHLGDVIGRGGMGVVHRGEHVLLNKPVAIKVLHHGVAPTGESAGRLVIEARAACRARHPGIVDVSDIGRLADGRTFLVMELIEAPTLESRLADGPLPVRRALAIAAALADALSAAADAGVVHCDVKPANVFVLDGDRIKIGDFGVARVAASTGTGGVAGTAWYMAPEQVREEALDARTDQYALGILLFEMMTGRVPFDGERPAEVLTAHLTEALPPMVGPKGLVPDAVQAIVRRATDKDPGARYPTTAAIAAALREALGALEAE